MCKIRQVECSGLMTKSGLLNILIFQINKIDKNLTGRVNLVVNVSTLVTINYKILVYTVQIFHFDKK